MLYVIQLKLYGSYARGDFNSDSDIDIYLLYDEINIKNMDDLISEITVKYGIMINITNVLLERGNIVYDKELAKDITGEELLKKYRVEDMKLCYEKGKLIGVYILQWYDPLFWSNLMENESGILHKLAVCRENAKKGYGSKLIHSAELMCKEHNIKWWIGFY